MNIVKRKTTNPLLIFSASFFAFLGLLACSLGGRSAVEIPTMTPSPHPPVAAADSGSDSSPKSAIYGTVRDLSTDRPGVGISVSINEATVRTDSGGHYAISGLSAGEYVILPKLDGQDIQAHDPVRVKLDGRSQADVQLAYYSQTQPLPTDTPPAAVASFSPPETLPIAGAPFLSRPWLLVGVGLLLSGVGVSWFIRSYA